MPTTSKTTSKTAKTTSNKALQVEFTFMKKDQRFTLASLTAKVKKAVNANPPKDATHYKHQIDLGKLGRGIVNHPVTYVWFAQEILEVPAMVMTNDGQSMRGAYNPSQVVTAVNRHLAPLGLRATSEAPTQGNFEKKGKVISPPKGANLAHAASKAISARQRLIDNHNKAEIASAKRRKLAKSSK